jgi:hypothetical protein
MGTFLKNGQAAHSDSMQVVSCLSICMGDWLSQNVLVLIFQGLAAAQQPA